MERAFIDTTLALALVSAVSVAASPASAGSLTIGGAWIQTPPAGARTAAGYLAVTNRGAGPDRLLAATSPVARSVELHTMSTAGGVMRMRSPPGGLAIAPGATVALWPGGGHLMLIGPAHPLRPGEHVPVTLRFARAGQVKADFLVRDTPPAPPR